MYAEIGTGIYTPWGIALAEEVLDEGVLWIETANHGGILIESERAQTLLSANARVIGKKWDKFLCFEQEHAMAVVFYEHPEWYMWVEDDLTQKLAEDMLRQDYPEYFATAS